MTNETKTTTRRIDTQVTIETLNVTVLSSLRDFIIREGLEPIVYTTRRQGIPFYLLSAKDGNSYVCSLAVYQYMMNKISTKMDIRLQEDKKGEHFRIFPKIAVTVHKDKGAFNTIVYTDILKGDYTTEELLDLSILPIEE
jgi:hypothetical protein